MTTPQQTNSELLHATKEMEVLSQQLNGQVSSLSSDIAALQERVSRLEQVPTVENLQERLLTLEIKVQNSLDLTDDLVGTADSVLAQANNVLAQADTVLTLYLFGITALTSVVMIAFQYYWNKRRDEMIAELKKEHTDELTEKVDQVEEKFIHKLNVDENFLDALTGALAQNKNFQSVIKKQGNLPSSTFDEDVSQADIDSVKNDLG